MKINLCHQPRGIAIIFVMVSIFFLSALAFGFAMSMKVETRLAMNSNSEAEVEWIGRSGVEYARWILGQSLKNPRQPYDSLDQKWAGGEGDTNDILSEVSLSDVTLGKNGGKFSVKIMDCERKININTALNNEPLLQHALTFAGVDASDAPTIISSIEDWIDPDSDTRVNGAESDYYEGLNPPYDAKNGPFDDISELLLVKGVTPELYWGPDWTNHAPPSFQAQQRSALFDTKAGAPVVTVGLVDMFTPVSSGLLNILTASSSQLQMLPMVDDHVAEDIIRLRSEGTGPDGTLPYGQPADLLINTTLGQQLAQQVSPYCTFRSTTFEVQVDVEIGMTKRTYYALLHRNSPNDIQILSLHWK